MAESTSIKVLSANCQGLRTIEKRVDVLSYFKETGASIVCLQDTHLLPKDTASIKDIWPDCYLHGIKTNSRGVAILLNNNFDYTVSKCQKDKNGNYMQLLLTCNSMKINLITIYAPNQDDPKFFEEIKNLANNDDSDYVIICGDFNLVIDPQKDCKNYVNLNNPKARSIVLDTINDLDLIDIYRTLNPNTKRYTWRKKNPLKQARLDLFLISNSMSDLISTSAIRSGYRSDHSIVELDISLHNFKLGRGIWKLNNSLLKIKII